MRLLGDHRKELVWNQESGVEPKFSANVRRVFFTYIYDWATELLVFNDVDLKKKKKERKKEKEKKYIVKSRFKKRKAKFFF